MSSIINLFCAQTNTERNEAWESIPGILKAIIIILAIGSIFASLAAYDMVLNAILVDGQSILGIYKSILYPWMNEGFFTIMKATYFESLRNNYVLI